MRNKQTVLLYPFITMHVHFLIFVVASFSILTSSVTNSQAIDVQNITTESFKFIGELPKHNLRSSINEDGATLLKYKFGMMDEDVNLNITQLLGKYGCSVEQHQVKTKDGYKLTMFRIPKEGPPVLLMHGILLSADDWVTPGPDHGLAYLLSSENYDVWLGNARGNKHSRDHEELSPNDHAFWHFSWDEIGRYDLPAMIDYILSITKQSRLKMVGHSQGTTAFFVLNSEKPEYNEKISIMVALSPLAWTSHTKSPIVKLLSPLNPFRHKFSEFLGINEFVPDNDLINFLSVRLCGNNIMADIFCSNSIFLISGYDYGERNITNLPITYGHVPSGSATRQLLHYGQGVVTGKFRRFDFGNAANIRMYGSKVPPKYGIHKITVPVALFFSDSDWLASVEDVKILRKVLIRVADFYEIKNFNHLDYLWGNEVKEKVFNRLLGLLRQY